MAIIRNISHPTLTSAQLHRNPPRASTHPGHTGSKVAAREEEPLLLRSAKVESRPVHNPKGLAQPAQKPSNKIAQAVKGAASLLRGKLNKILTLPRDFFNKVPPRFPDCVRPILNWPIRWITGQNINKVPGHLTAGLNPSPSLLIDLMGGRAPGALPNLHLKGPAR